MKLPDDYDLRTNEQWLADMAIRRRATRLFLWEVGVAVFRGGVVGLLMLALFAAADWMAHR